MLNKRIEHLCKGTNLTLAMLENEIRNDKNPEFLQSSDSHSEMRELSIISVPKDENIVISKDLLEKEYEKSQKFRQNYGQKFNMAKVKRLDDAVASSEVSENDK